MDKMQNLIKNCTWIIAPSDINKSLVLKKNFYKTAFLFYCSFPFVHLHSFLYLSLEFQNTPLYIHPSLILNWGGKRGIRRYQDFDLNKITYFILAIPRLSSLIDPILMTVKMYKITSKQYFKELQVIIIQTLLFWMKLHFTRYIILRWYD